VLIYSWRTCTKIVLHFRYLFEFYNMSTRGNFSKKFSCPADNFQRFQRHINFIIKMYESDLDKN